MGSLRTSSFKAGTRPRTNSFWALAVIPLLVGAVQAEPAARNYDPAIISLLDRLTFGATIEDAERLQAAGAKRWLDSQLHPMPQDSLPATAQAQIDAMPITQKPMTELVADIAAKSKVLNQITDPDLKKAAGQAYQQTMNDLAKQAAVRQILRDLYSPTQVLERMTWFWFNHFNVHQSKADIRPMVADYEDKGPSAYTRSVASETYLPRPCAIPRCCAISTMRRTPSVTSMRTMLERSWNCTPWASAPVIHSTMSKSSRASLPALALTPHRKTQT
jgi:hypothetical protein